MSDNYLEPHSSERLHFRRISSDLIEKWKVFLADYASKPHFPDSSRDDELFAEKWIQGQLIRYAEGRYGLLAAYEKESGDFVGQIGLITQMVGDKVELEIGYHLMPDHRGKGYAVEAAKYFKAFAKSHSDYSSVVSFIHPENRASQRVAERNGMHIDGQTIHHGVAHDIWRFSFS